MTQRTKHLNARKETKQRDEMNYKPNITQQKGKRIMQKILHLGLTLCLRECKFVSLSELFLQCL